MALCLELFLTFARIGLFTFGGGYAMLPLIETICVTQKKWITHEQMMTVTVVAESTPGPIAINCATYTGYVQAGLRGAAAATFGVVLPSFLVIFGISMFLDDFLEITLISSAFRGIKIAVGILIVNAGLTMLRKRKKKTPFSSAMVLVSFSAMLLADLLAWSLSSLTLMAAAALAGLFLAGAEGGGGA